MYVFCMDVCNVVNCHVYSNACFSTCWDLESSPKHDVGLYVTPSTALVEKKAMFFVSSGLSLVNSMDLLCGSDSPVKEELST